jgi:hypothetical protein
MIDPAYRLIRQVVVFSAFLALLMGQEREAPRPNFMIDGASHGR